MGSFRKLGVGDLLTMVVNTEEGWADLTINLNEFTHRFTLPSPVKFEDYHVGVHKCLYFAGFVLR